MRTSTIEIENPNKLSKMEKEEIKDAAKLITEGKLVVFPTETVYGVGANALDPIAVKSIFKAKGRPSDNPIIVHICDKKDLKPLVDKVPEKAQKLIDKFWPGPITLVMNKSEIIPFETTGELETVAVRMPNHPVAIELIRAAKVPIAAPSANISGKPSTTNADHAFGDLNGKVDIIIKCGESEIGVESTVVDMTTNLPQILRPGIITKEQIEKVIGKIENHPRLLGKELGIRFRSPGMKYRHYAPESELILIKGKKKEVKKRIESLINQHQKRGRVVGVLVLSDSKYKADIIKCPGKTAPKIAQNLFKVLREFDKLKPDIIFCESIEKRGIGFAIMDRLERAADHKIIEVKDEE